MMNLWKHLIFVLLCVFSAVSQAAWSIRYQHTDVLGSVIAESNEQGTITQRFGYKPFGEGSPTQKTGVGYTGHLEDTDLGLTYMQQRYYDPVIGRFYSNDPVDMLGHMRKGNPTMGFNRYAYANNNPYKYTDPDGQFIDIVLDVAFIAVDLVDMAVNGVNETNTASLAANVAGALIPGATGLGLAARAGDKGVDAANALRRSCCFVAGTQVLTENGYKNIEDVKLGEKLWAKNTDTGEQAWKPVTKIFVEPDRGIYEIKLVGSDNFTQKIQATDDHPFYVLGKGWKQTIELKTGDKVETDGNGMMEVASVIDEKRFDLTYNFTVADFHTYYITKQRILVHNCSLGNANIRVLEKTTIRHKDISMDVERGGSGKINVHAEVDGVKFFRNEDGQFVSKKGDSLNKKIVNDPKFQKAIKSAERIIKSGVL